MRRKRHITVLYRFVRKWFRPSLTGGLVAVCVLLIAGGCGKKHVRSGMPFELDKVFVGIPSTIQESAKDKGIRLAKEGQFKSAIEAFEEHIKEEPQSFFGFNGLAVCYKNIGDYANAMKNFEQALKYTGSQQDRAKVLANIGNLYFSEGKPQAALGYYKEAAAEFDKNPLYLIFIAQAFVVLNDYDRARKVLTTAEEFQQNLEKYERDEDRGLGSYLMAKCYLALNDENKVYHHLENALRSNAEKYVSRIETDTSDEKNLLYTLKDDKRLRSILNKFSSLSKNPEVRNRRIGST